MTASHILATCNLATAADHPMEKTIPTDFHYSTGEELEQFLNEKCKEDPDLLATIISEYLCSLSDTKLIELEDFLCNNFGDD